MAASTLALVRFPLTTLLREPRIGSPLLSAAASIFLILFIALYLGTFIDERLFHGVSVWDKPAKFFLSLALHMATLAWGLSFLTAADRRSGLVVGASRIFVAAAIFEVAYITFQASRGEASHFNTSTTITTVMYSLMGAGAVILAAVTTFLGWLILTRGSVSTLTLATGLGFILGGIFAVAFGGYMSSQDGHWVGGIATDASGLPFLGWSTSGGDLRVAHFFGLHAMQALPLAGYLLRHRSARFVWGAAALWTLLTIAVFAQALMGMPLLG
jgi:hypothetical protein